LSLNIFEKSSIGVLIFILPLFSQIVDQDDEGGFFELTPVVGFAGASPIFGIKGSMVYPVMELQLSFDLISGKFTNLYPITVSAILPLGHFNNATPYASVGGGMSVTAPQNAVGGNNITEGHLIFGGGLKYYMDDYIGYRFEIGQTLTRIKNQQTKKETLFFYQQITIGVSISFGRRT